MTAGILRRGIFAGLGLAALAALGGGVAGPAQAADPLKVRFILNWKYQGPQAWFFLADDKGYFKQAGIDIQLDQGAGSGAAVPKVASTAYDAGFGDINAITRFGLEEQGQTAGRRLHDLQPDALRHRDAEIRQGREAEAARGHDPRRAPRMTARSSCFPPLPISRASTQARSSGST